MENNKMIIPMHEFNLILYFMPEFNRPTGGGDSTEIDWNTLMPVVHKILKEWVPKKGGWPYEYLNLQNTGLGNGMDQIYMRVVEFIKWYNNHGK